MNKAEKWIVAITCVLIAIYTTSSLAFASQDCALQIQVVFLLFNVAQVHFYIIIIVELNGFTYKAGLSKERYLGATTIAALLFSHLAVPWQYYFFLGPANMSAMNIFMKVSIWVVLVLNTIQGITYYAFFIYWFYRLMFTEFDTDPELSRMLKTKWYRSRMEELEQLKKFQKMMSNDALQFLSTVYVPNLDHSSKLRLYSQPIVMAYIFAICTWVIPSDDTVWTRETCDICSAAYKQTETVLINHEGHHLHEYCARRWFPSLGGPKRQKQLSSTRLGADLTKYRSLFHWVDQLGAIAALRRTESDHMPLPGQPMVVGLADVELLPE